MTQPNIRSYRDVKQTLAERFAELRLKAGMGSLSRDQVSDLILLVDQVMKERRLLRERLDEMADAVRGRAPMSRHDHDTVPAKQQLQRR